jgi:hypothetical protein
MLVERKIMVEINRLKVHLARTFDMNDIGAKQQILGIEIHRDMKNDKICLSQHTYMEKILMKFGMHAMKPVNVPLASHFNLSS